MREIAGAVNCDIANDSYITGSVMLTIINPRIKVLLPPSVHQKMVSHRQKSPTAKDAFTISHV